MDRRKHLSLLLVRGDGSRVVRFNVPRRLPLAILAVATLAVAGLGVLVGDWWLMRSQMRQAGAAPAAVSPRSTVSGLDRRLAELQKEVASWRELHARIWEPFGPDAAPKGRATGIGGPRSADLSGAGRPPRVLAAATASEELDRLTEAVLQEGESLRALDRLISRAGKVLASLPSRWPLRGVVNSEFGGRQSPWTKRAEIHSGIDIAAERGTRVHAPAAGTVAFAGSHGEYGLSVVLEHGEDLRTIYGHLSKISVTAGQQVARGAELGLSGNSGRSSGPHLHYEILVKNRPVNPRAYFWD